MASPYKTIPIPGTFGVLQSRRTQYQQGPHYKAAIRNPAWATVSANGTTLPRKDEKFTDVYRPNFKPGALLKSLSVQHGGDFGLTMEMNCTIQCHTKGQFEAIEKAFMVPGTKVSVSFGYSNTWGNGYQGSRTINGFTTATYSFNTTSEGFWIATFKAVAPAIALKDINLGMNLDTKGRQFIGKSIKGDVVGIPQLIAYHAQVNGATSIDKMIDGEVISPGKGNIVIYDNKHLYKPFRRFFKNLGKGNEVDKTENVVYVSLQYVVDTIINDEILGEYRKIVTDSDFDNCRVKFDPILSKSYPDISMQSAYPVSILFLGAGVGNYENDNGDGKNFEQVSNISSVSCIDGTSGARLILNHKNILIQRDVVLEALDDSFSKKKSAETNDVKDSTEGVINLETFFGKIFNEISKATGGMIKLRLSQHPDIHKGGGGSLVNELYIFDENNGFIGDALKCYVFNPIDGDGSTRNCSITSDVGSRDYQGNIFAGQKKQSDPQHETFNKINNGNTAGRESKRDNTVQKIENIIYNPGTLGANQFSNNEMQSLEECMGALRLGSPEGKNKDMLVYPGLGIDIELDGVFGFLPGNAISTTQLSSAYFNSNTYFFVESVEHIFDGESSDWLTKLTGKLSFHSSVNYI